MIIHRKVNTTLAMLVMSAGDQSVDGFVTLVKLVAFIVNILSETKNNLQNLRITSVRHSTCQLNIY
jgi:hypothetical protein